MCRIQNQKAQASSAPTSGLLSVPESKDVALPSTAPSSRGVDPEFAPEEFGLRLPPSLAELRRKYSREKGSTASAQVVVPKPLQMFVPASKSVEDAKAKDSQLGDSKARQVLFHSVTFLAKILCHPPCLLLV